MCISLLMQITNGSSMSSSLYIDAADASALLDNGVYSCHVRVTIAGVDSFEHSSGNSVVSFKGIMECCIHCCLVMHASIHVYSNSVMIVLLYVVHSNLRAVNITQTSIVFKWDAPAFEVVSQYNITCANANNSFSVSGYAIYYNRIVSLNITYYAVYQHNNIMVRYIVAGRHVTDE